MKKRSKVKEIMTTKLVSLSAYTGKLQEAKELMEEHQIRHLPIVDNVDNLVGIISLSDIHRISFGGNYGQEGSVDKSIFDTLSLGQVMMHEPKTITSDTSIKEAAEILAVEEFHALPVVDEAKIVGLVTSTDLIKYLIQQY